MRGSRFFSTAALVAALMLVGCGAQAPDQGTSSPSAGSDAGTSVATSAATSTEPEPEPAVDEGPSWMAPGVSKGGRLSVSGTQVVDQDGNPFQLKGLSTHGIAWFPDYVDSQCFADLRASFGINCVRLAMYTAEYGGYCSGGDQAQLRDLVDKGVQAAVDNDMYVIVDWHILSDANPLQNEEAAIAFFQEMSARYADCPNVIFEICNEPNSGTQWSDIKAYAERVIPVIRQNAPDAIVVVGTPNWSQFLMDAAADPIADQMNVMYTLHFYAATHKDDLRQTLTQAHDAGLPVLVTEFGICDASGSGQIDEESANQWIDLMDQYGVSYLMWNVSNKEESSSIFVPECTKTSGFAPGDLSQAGQWYARTLTGGESPLL